jgi:tRNA A37 methylthiotransferase MiaB
MAKLHVITYGCQMNEYDSERVAGLLKERAWELTEREGDADLILINSPASSWCSDRRPSPGSVTSSSR